MIVSTQQPVSNILKSTPDSSLTYSLNFSYVIIQGCDDILGIKFTNGIPRTEDLDVHSLMYCYHLIYFSDTLEKGTYDHCWFESGNWSICHGVVACYCNCPAHNKCWSYVVPTLYNIALKFTNVANVGAMLAQCFVFARRSPAWNDATITLCFVWSTFTANISLCNVGIGMCNVNSSMWTMHCPIWTMPSSMWYL